MKKLFLCVYLLFAGLINIAVCQNAPTGEAKNLEKAILKAINLPSEYSNAKKANVFAIKFSVSADNKLVNISGSKNAPEPVVKRVLQLSTYDKINWAAIRSGDGVSDLVVIVAVFPDERSGFSNDKSESIPYFAYSDIDGLLNFQSDVSGKHFELLPFTVQNAYGKAMH